jgi:hypothetical protein
MEREAAKDRSPALTGSLIGGRMGRTAYMLSTNDIGRSEPVSDKTNHVSSDQEAATKQLADINELLAEWAASSTEDNPALVERLEQMGYEVRGKSRETVTEVLKHPPSKRSNLRS